MRESQDRPCPGRALWRTRAVGFAAGVLCASAVAWAAGPPEDPAEPPPVPTLYSGTQPPDLPPEWRWSPPPVRYEPMYRQR